MSKLTSGPSVVQYPSWLCAGPPFWWCGLHWPPELPENCCTPAAAVSLHSLYRSRFVCLHGPFDAILPTIVFGFRCSWWGYKQSETTQIYNQHSTIWDNMTWHNKITLTFEWRKKWKLTASWQSEDIRGWQSGYKTRHHLREIGVLALTLVSHGVHIHRKPIFRSSH